MDKRIVNQVPSSIEPTTVPVPTSLTSHIPIYQPFNHSITQINSNKSNGFNIESKPFQINNESHNKSDIQLDNQITAIIPSSGSFAHQFSPTNLSRTSSMSDRDRITDSPLPMPNFTRNQNQHRDNFSPNLILASKSSPPQQNDPTTIIPRNDEFTPRINNLNYPYQEPTIATLEHQRIDHLRQNVSPQMIHFQQIEDRMVDQLNELYKATMMIHANQQPQRIEQDECDRINQPYVQQQQQQPQQQQHEPLYNPGELLNSIYYQKSNDSRKSVKIIR